MKKFKKSSAFDLIAKARSEKDKPVSHGESKHEAGSVEYGNKSGAQADESVKMSKNYISINSERKCKSNKKGPKLSKHIIKTPEYDASSSSESTDLSEKRYKSIDESVIDVDMVQAEVIEILDEDSEIPTAQDANRTIPTGTNKANYTIEKKEGIDIVEIESDDDFKPDRYIDLSQTKKRRKKRPENSRKRERRWSLSDQVYSDKSYMYESDNLVQPEVPLVAEEDSLSCVHMKDGVLLFINHPCELMLKGRVRIQCVSGSVQIMGYSLGSGHPPLEVYSPVSNSFLTLTTTQCEPNVHKILESIKKTNADKTKQVENMLKKRKSCVAVKLNSLASSMCDLLTNHSPFYDLFETNQDGPVNEILQTVGVSVHSVDDENFPVLKIGDDIQSIIAKWNSSISGNECDEEKQPVMMLCGSKNTGKSTTNRLLINNSLNRLDCVYFLDCDPGQVEFTPPGCVSLVRVTEPVFGPPFSHQRSPVCSYYFGGITPTDDPDGYINCVYKCVEHYKSLDVSGPLIVNTMGWIEDMGLQLLVDTARMVEPTFLVHLLGRLSHRLPQLLYKETSWTDLSPKKIPTCDILRQRRLPEQIYIEPDTNRSFSDGSQYNSRVMRDLTTLAHLTQHMEPGLSLYTASPYCVKWEDVAVHICQKSVPRSQIMYALNASLVGLCEADLSKAVRSDEGDPMFFDEVPMFNWKGCGIIRGIDSEEKAFYVITSLKSEELQTVNCIVKGSATLPQHVLMDQDCENVPYVDGRVASYGEKGLKPRRRQRDQNKRD